MSIVSGNKWNSGLQCLHSLYKQQQLIMKKKISTFFLIAGRVVVLNLTLFDRSYSKLCAEMYHQTRYEYNFVKIASGSSRLKT